MREPLSVPGPLAEHAGLVVRRPHPWKPLVPVVVLLGSIAGILALFGDVSSAQQGKGVVVGALGVIALPFMLHRVWKAVQLRGKGWGSYAVSDEAFLVIDLEGNAQLGVVRLSSITKLHLGQWEVPVIGIHATVNGEPGVLELVFPMFSNNGSIGEILLQPTGGKAFFDELSARVRRLHPEVPVTRWRHRR
jgi:hypothetical protein